MHGSSQFFDCDGTIVERAELNQHFGNRLNPFFHAELICNGNKGGHPMTKSNIATAGCLMLVLSFTGGAALADVSPFRAMAGTWSGGGMLSTADGGQEQLRCRASYNVAGAGDELHLSLRCASDSYNFDLASNVEYRGGAISGEWTEASRNASGTIEGRAAGDHVEAAARGQNFSADLSLTTRGNRQTISIRPQGGGDIRAVSLSLGRR
jgi:hypothetical protein